MRWVAVPAVGAVIALWSVATMAGLDSVGTSLTAASNGLPQSLLAPRTIALADARRALAWAPQLSANGRRASLLGQCDAGCLRAASSFGHDGKMARLQPAAKPDIIAPKTPNAVALAALPGDRFDGVVARAKLSPQKLAAVFARAQNGSFMLASLPSDARFAEPVVRMPDQNGPASVRFGPQVAEIERSSRLALALANAMPEADMLSPPPSVALAPPDVQQEPQQAEVQLASLPPQDEMPEIPLPTGRPQAEIDQPAQAPEAESPKPQASRTEAPKTEAPKAQAPKAQAAKTTKAQSAKAADMPPAGTPRAPALSPRSAEHGALPGVQVSQGVQGSQSKQASQGKPAKPAKRSKAQDGEMLAYAKPDMPERGAGGVFGNLFTSRPSMGNGVAVYDISAKTVYMPDGSRLEAHSGLGSMVDQPRFVHKKNVGPTPPDTYNLSLRESRFHGVEAIRLTPASGNNKYGRDGLLAHTYMLRGGRAESNGCVVFKDYSRFLAAYKKGKIKRLVVVPRMSKPLTQVAQEGRAG
ncbi:DUF2778 domain-containing protein [Mesorhizobium waimense]|uniref:DUF2778 domain-containing protein n=2 Tax=Mesorhizobium waimense TaxID=1300307 RepID=A0A3A5K2Q2_9HYPH|nr:DUF2778 domain-containing protein [Mesorhizobium waimense]